MNYSVVIVLGAFALGALFLAWDAWMDSRDEEIPPPSNVVDLTGKTLRFGDRETRQ